MSTNRSNCEYDEDYMEKWEYVEMLVAWYLVSPIHYIFGTPGHILLLVSFYKRYKHEKAYMYQVYSTISEFLELQFWILLVLTVHVLSGSEGNDGVVWYKQCYTCMWYATKLAHAMYSTFFTLSLVLSVAMTADRVYATARSIKYRTIPQHKYQSIALLISLGVSVSTGFSDSMRYSMRPVRGAFEIESREADVVRPVTIAMGHLRNTVRITALIILISLSVILLRVVRKKYNKIGPDLGICTEEEKRRREFEKMLFRLTVCQSLFQTVSVLSSVAFFTAIYTSSYFAMCMWGIFAPFMDITIEICDLADLYFSIIINEQYRRTFMGVFPLFKHQCGTVRVENAETRM